MSEKQIDLMGSPWRMLGLFLGSLAFVAVCPARRGSRQLRRVRRLYRDRLLRTRRLGERAQAVPHRPGRLGRPARALRPPAIDRLDLLGCDPSDRRFGHDQRWAIVLFDPAREAFLPIRETAKTLARVNQAFGFVGYHVSATELRGGFPALSEALRATRKHG